MPKNQATGKECIRGPRFNHRRRPVCIVVKTRMAFLPGIVAALLILSFVLRWLRNRAASQGTLVVLGSGGHTAEMCVILQAVGAGNVVYEPRSFVAADTDRTSEAAAVANGTLPHGSRIVRIPRSREVGQSYATAVLSTARSMLAAFAVVWKVKPRLVLCNGPGTCLPVCLAAWSLTALGVCRTRIAFVESVCRCTSLSMTGRLLYSLHIADEVLVQWPELAAK